MALRRKPSRGERANITTSPTNNASPASTITNPQSPPASFLSSDFLPVFVPGKKLANSRDTKSGKMMTGQSRFAVKSDFAAQPNKYVRRQAGQAATSSV